MNPTALSTRPTDPRAAAGGGAPGPLLRRALFALGSVTLAGYASYTLLSWGLVRFLPTGEPEPLENGALDALARSLEPWSTAVATYLRGGVLPQRPAFLLAVYLIPLVVCTAAFAALLALLSRERRRLDERSVAAVFHWSLAFGALLVLAAPVLVQDFWLSPAWGRMIAQGVNPYETPLNPGIAGGLPLDYVGQRMTYGPLWAVVSGALAAIAGGHPWLAGLLFKLVLAGAWALSLWLVRDLLRTRSCWHQAVGIALLGWLPLVLLHTIADGHNDILMVAFVLAWLRWRERGRPVPATFALAASVAVKYVSAPLFLLDLLLTWRARRRLRDYAPQALAAAALLLAVFAPFFRGTRFFTQTAEMGGWHFFTPRDALLDVARLLGAQPSLSSPAGLLAALPGAAAQGFFLLLALAGVVRFWRTPSVTSLRNPFLALVSGLLFGAIGHLWPWFLVFGVAAAALLPEAPLARWVVGVALAAPFAILAWVIYPALPPTTYVPPTVAMYAFALLWLIPARRWQAQPAAGGRPATSAEDSPQHLPAAV